MFDGVSIIAKASDTVLDLKRAKIGFVTNTRKTDATKAERSKQFYLCKLDLTGKIAMKMLIERFVKV